MLKDLFNKRCKIQLEHVEMKALEDPSDDIEEIKVTVKDSVAWEKKENCLRVECTRHVGFEPACNFEIMVTYSVEHFLSEKNMLDKVTDSEIEKDVQEDVPFYIQERQGLISRVSLIIAQLTSSFNGAPMVLPPYYQKEEYTL